MTAPLPANEEERLFTLRATRLLESSPDPDFDEITALTSCLLRVPIVVFSLLDEGREWFKSRIGTSIAEIPREHAFCAHTILEPEGIVVPDTLKDPRFAENPFVTHCPWVRFYAGVPLKVTEGHALGALCVIDIRPRDDFDAERLHILRMLGNQLGARIHRRRSSDALVHTLIARRRAELKEDLAFRIAAAMGGDGDLSASLQSVLRHLCNATGWVVGEAWLASEESASVQYCDAWHAIYPALETFRPAAGRIGGLAARAWQSRKPVFVRDLTEDPAFERREAALALGIEGGAAFPILMEGKPIAVLNFLMRRDGAGDPELISLVAAVTADLGPALLRKRLEGRLSRENQNKDRFLATMAHELRNPLTPILHSVALLRTAEPGDAVEVIERQVRHLSRLVDDLLDLSRITRGKITLSKTRLDLVTAVRRAARSSLLEARQPLTVDLPSEPLWMEADPVRIEQIVGNLLHNAGKYSEPGKPIRLSLRREGNEALLRVEDRGIGIPFEMLERVFEPFMQLDESVGLRRGGLGVGLPLVRQLAGLHGGIATAHSEGPGRGSEFSVRLPLAEPSRAVPAPGGTESPRARPGAAPRRRILVVEDHPDVRATLGRLLATWGHAVDVAASGAEALEKAGEFKPDAFLIDIGLPGMDGCELARRLSEIPGLQGAALLAMSGYCQEADRRHALDAGFQDYLVKPIEPAFLRERLDRLESRG